MAFDTLTVLCNQYLYLVSKQFPYSKVKFFTHLSSFSQFLQPLETNQSAFCSYRFTCSEYFMYMKSYRRYGMLLLISLNRPCVVFSMRSHHLGARVLSYGWMHHIYLIPCFWTQVVSSFFNAS